MSSIALWFRRLFAMSAVLLAACGGGGGGNGGGGGSAGDDNGTDSSDEVVRQQLAGLDSLASNFAALTPDTPDVDAQAMLAWMSTRAEYVAPEIVQPGVIAYNFADGTPGIVDLRRRIENPSQLGVMAPGSIGVAAVDGRPSAQAVRVLERRRVFLFDALTQTLGEQSWAVITGLSAWFRRAGFSVDTTAFTTPTSLLSVRAADVLYIDAHGGVGRYERSGASGSMPLPRRFRSTRKPWRCSRTPLRPGRSPSTGCRNCSTRPAWPAVGACSRTWRSPRSSCART